MDYDDERSMDHGERRMARHERHVTGLERLAVRQNAEERERGELIDLYSDTYKDHHGVRPRHIDFKKISLGELRRKYEELAALPLPPNDF